MGRWSIATAAVVCGLGAAGAQASPAGQQAMRNWGAMDQCAKDAQAAFPDYSAEAYAKRDAKMKECLEKKSLPPRTPLGN